MNNGTLAPTHLEQIEEALEERQNQDRRQPPSNLEGTSPLSEERRQQDRRKNAENV